MSRLPGPPDDVAERAADVVRGVTHYRTPRAAIIFGSGLAGAADVIDADVTFEYTGLPGFSTPSVPGHTGALIIGDFHDEPNVAAFLGRMHLYEGHSMAAVTLPVRVAAALGARTLVSTAAVGGLDPAMESGSLVVGADHLNFLGENPLRGWRDAEGRPPFVDAAGAYDPALAEAAVRRAKELGIPVHRGVYAAMPGPAYETPAEIEFLRRAGASVVGMSVVPEAVAAAALRMRFLGLYCVTNVVGTPVDHQEVVRVAGEFSSALGKLLVGLAREL
jgi:purine-nucleoside phosphorylase